MYRKYRISKNPIEEARNHIGTRIFELEKIIVSRFEFSNPRDKQIIKKTIRQFVDAQNTIEGKIRKLMALLEEVDISNIDSSFKNYFLDDLTDFGPYFHQNSRVNYEKQSSRKLSPVQNLNSSIDSCKIEKQVKYSPLSKEMSRKRQQKSLISSFNLTQNEQNEQPSKQMMTDSLLSKLKNKSEASLLSRSKTDNIKENDIFSFRTQNRQTQDQSHKISTVMNDSGCSGLFSKLVQRRNNNYDGYSQEINVLLQQDNSGCELETKKQLYEKIKRRIKLSTCIINKVDHSNSANNSNHLIKRYKLQKQLRKQLQKQMINNIHHTSNWKC